MSDYASLGEAIDWIAFGVLPQPTHLKEIEYGSLAEYKLEPGQDAQDVRDDAWLRLRAHLAEGHLIAEGCFPSLDAWPFDENGVRFHSSYEHIRRSVPPDLWQEAQWCKTICTSWEQRGGQDVMVSWRATRVATADLLRIFPSKTEALEPTYIPNAAPTSPATEAISDKILCAATSAQCEPAPLQCQRLSTSEFHLPPSEAPPADGIVIGSPLQIRRKIKSPQRTALHSPESVIPRHKGGAPPRVRDKVFAWLEDLRVKDGPKILNLADAGLAESFTAEQPGVGSERSIRDAIKKWKELNY